MKNIALFLFSLVFTSAAYTQNVGIGTSFPSFPLHVVKNAPNVELARFQSSGGSGKILVGNGSAFSAIGHTGIYGYTGTESQQDFSIRTGQVNRMYFQQGTGNIGIGTITPSCPLDVLAQSGAVNIATFTGNEGTRQIEVSNGIISSNFGTDVSKGYVGTDTYNDFSLRVGGEDAIFIKEGSRFVGLGTISPIAPMHLLSTTNSDLAIFEGTNSYTQLLVSNGITETKLGADQTKGFVGTNTESDFFLRAGGNDIISLMHDSQYVGIGTSFPECRFNVVADDPYSDVAIFKNTSGSSSVLISNGTKTLGLAAYPSYCEVGSFTPSDLALTTFGQTRLFVQHSSGNVGIGTISPGSLLDVHSTQSNVDIARFTGNGGYGQIQVSNGNINTHIGSSDEYGYAGTQTNNDFAILTGAEPKMIVKYNGYVGLGTTNPLSPLHVFNSINNGYLATFESTASDAKIQIGSGVSNIAIGSTGTVPFVGTYLNQKLSILTNGLERICVQNSGNVGIGTSAPNLPLTIRADAAQNILQYKNNSDQAVWHWWLPGNDLVLTETGVADYRMTIKKTSGFVGINQANPTQQLDVNGNVKISGQLTVNTIAQPSTTGVSFSNGNFSNYGGGYENVTYYKDKEGRVHLSGLVLINGTQSGVMFNLPSGYRPAGQLIFLTMAGTGPNRIDVMSNGDVSITSTNGWISVNGISFRAN